MQTRESHLVRDLSISSTCHELHHCVFHVSLSGKMERCVTSQIYIIHSIWLGSIREQNLNDVHILFVNGILQQVEQLHQLNFSKSSLYLSLT